MKDNTIELELLCKLVKALQTLEVLIGAEKPNLTEEDKKASAGLVKMINHVLDFADTGRCGMEITDLLLGSLENREDFQDNKTFSRWLEHYQSKVALLLLQQLTMKPEVDIETAKNLLHFYECAPVDKESKGLALYLLAANLAEADPELSYINILFAFQTCPKLGNLLGQEYLYDLTQLKETYTEICPICGSESYTPHYCVSQFLIANNDSALSPAKLWLKCNQCHNLYAFNFPISRVGEMNGHYTADTALTPRQPLHIYSDIFNKCLTYTSGKRYLEIGIGNGEMAASALEMGFEVEAVEICPEDACNVSAALGIPVTNCNFLDFQTIHEYDVVVMGDVLEHISKPLEALKKVAGLLSADGVLWLSTPNYNSGFSRMMKFRDPLWNQKNHFTYFSFETLEPFLKAVGLIVAGYDISCRFKGSMELFCVKSSNEP